MAQIVTITNPLTGQPAQVDQLEHTAQQIDDGIGFESTDYPGCYYRMVGGVTEWVNPPMILGEEYRTTERFNGKPVYIKATDCGFGPTTDSTKVVEDVIQNCKKIIDSGGNLGDANGLPYYGSESRQFKYSVGKYTIDLFAIGLDTSALNVVVWRKYTKTTD